MCVFWQSGMVAAEAVFDALGAGGEEAKAKEVVEYQERLAKSWVSGWFQPFDHDMSVMGPASQPLP
jgi:flavin-dependent dehydrogenase